VGRGVRGGPYLGAREGSVREEALDLAAGGVVEEAYEGVLRVAPGLPVVMVELLALHLARHLDRTIVADVGKAVRHGR